MVEVVEVSVLAVLLLLNDHGKCSSVLWYLFGVILALTAPSERKFDKK